MKGAVHARSLGYDSVLVTDAVEGDGEAYDWVRFLSSFNKGLEDAHGYALNHERCWPAQRLSKGELATFKKAVSKMAFTTRGGPKKELRQCILHLAEVRECADADAVQKDINGKRCPLAAMR